MIHIPFFKKEQDAGMVVDGLGQSTLTDLRWIRRFKTAAKKELDWRPPSDADRARFKDLPELDKFGDFLIAAAEVDGRRWFVVERMWNGWPDPPKYACFAIDADGSVWAAADFHRWPKQWAHEGIDL